MRDWDKAKTPPHWDGAWKRRRAGGGSKKDTLPVVLKVMFVLMRERSLSSLKLLVLY